MAAPEQKKSYQVSKNFKGVNTKANRTAIDETEFAWLENAMPIGYANIKVVPKQATVKDSGNNAIVFGNTVTYLANANLGVSDYITAFEQNGRAEYVNLTSSTKGNIASAGTFSSANVTTTQWKNERLVIADPNNGLFSWDGTNLVTIGSLGPIYVTNPGSGYTSPPTVTFSGGTHDVNGETATANASLTGNTVSALTMTNPGTGYTVAPTVNLTGGGGTGATAVVGIVTFATGTVTISVTNPGSGYTNSANVVVNISGGSPTTAATAQAVLQNGQIAAVVMTNPGAGYAANAAVTATISGGGGSGATLKVTVNSNQISGVQSFSGRVWVSQSRNVFYSAANSYSDFTSVSAGSITLTDATLHGNIQSLLSANNFLYVFGDDSINVFSDVRVTSTGATIFTNTNVSASVGSKRPLAIFPYFRSVLFLNDYGIYALVGSTTSKISDALDGVFPYIDFTAPITAGQVLLNNILCAAFSFQYKGPNDTSYRQIQAVFFEKKWFFTAQGNTLKYVTSVPVGGKISLYGVDNTNLYQLYSDTTSAVGWQVQTALWQLGDPIRTKQALKFGVEATLAQTATLSVTVDSETGSSPSYSKSNSVAWANNLGNTVQWQNNSFAPVQWVLSGGYFLYKNDAQQWGKYLGLTVSGTSPALNIHTFELEHELRVRF